MPEDTQQALVCPPQRPALATPKELGQLVTEAQEGKGSGEPCWGSGEAIRVPESGGALLLLPLQPVPLILV